jgi:hypothetical protein
MKCPIVEMPFHVMEEFKACNPLGNRLIPFWPESLGRINPSAGLFRVQRISMALSRSRKLRALAAS